LQVGVECFYCFDSQLSSAKHNRFIIFRPQRYAKIANLQRLRVFFARFSSADKRTAGIAPTPARRRPVQWLPVSGVILLIGDGG